MCRRWAPFYVPLPKGREHQSLLTDIAENQKWKCVVPVMQFRPLQCSDDLVVWPMMLFIDDDDIYHLESRALTSAKHQSCTSGFACAAFDPFWLADAPNPYRRSSMPIIPAPSPHSEAHHWKRLCLSGCFAHPLLCTAICHAQYPATKCVPLNRQPTVGQVSCAYGIDITQLIRNNQMCSEKTTPFSAYQENIKLGRSMHKL